MARTKCTPRKSTGGYIPPRVVVTIGKTVSEDMLQQLRDEEDDFEMEPMEEEPLEDGFVEEPMEEAPMEEEDEQEQQGVQEGAGNSDDGDDSDNYDSDDNPSDGGDDGSHGSDKGEDGGEEDDLHAARLADGWTVVYHYDLQGDDFYHPELVTLVRRYHPRCTVQYRTERWTHPDYTEFNETEVYIRQGSRVCYIHRAITPRCTRAAAIEDAARQALMVNRDRHFDDIKWEEHRYFPRRRSGQSSCNIAAPIGEENYRFKPTLEYLARVNTGLDQALDELDAMHESYLQVCHENVMLKQQLGGPAPVVPHVSAESPPRNRGGHGDPSTSTNLDP